jgi:hypothetical protein
MQWFHAMVFTCCPQISALQVALDVEKDKSNGLAAAQSAAESRVAALERKAGLVPDSKTGAGAFPGFGGSSGPDKETESRIAALETQVRGTWPPAGLFRPFGLPDLPPCSHGCS